MNENSLNSLKKHEYTKQTNSGINICGTVELKKKKYNDDENYQFFISIRTDQGAQDSEIISCPIIDESEAFNLAKDYLESIVNLLARFMSN